MPEVRPKTALSIGQGLWQFKVQRPFKRLMERVLADIPQTRFVYLDDLLAHATDYKGAQQNLKALLAFHTICQAESACRRWTS